MKRPGSIKYIPLKPVVLALVLAFLATACSYDLWIDRDAFDSGEAVALERNWDWYLTQMNTGPDSPSNCGPASAAMAVRYYRNSDVGVREVRDLLPARRGWWYLADVAGVLNHYGVSYSYRRLVMKEQIINDLAEGRLVIIVLDMSRLTPEDGKHETRYNRYYDGVTGHFIVLNGYTADKRWFSVYDPNTRRNDYYADASPKGKRRLYLADEVVASMKIWNPVYMALARGE